MGLIPPGPDLIGLVSQAYPPRAKYTEKSLSDLTGKVYFITGSNTGIGKHLATILYSKNATVYIAARSETKSLEAIASIQSEYPKSKGKLGFLPLDLADLSGIKSTVEKFLAFETRLDVLFNNAGVMMPPEGSKSKQGYDLQLGVNNIGPFLLTKLLTPVLKSTAKTAPAGSVRVVWVSSSAAEAPAVPKDGIPVDTIDKLHEKTNFQRYCISKSGNYYQATEYAKRHKSDGIISVGMNPGNLNSDLWREQGNMTMKILRTFVLHNPIKGAYTELFAGLSPDVNDKTGSWVVPWGRFWKIRKDLVQGSKTTAEGGTGIAAKFWEWNEAQVRAYV